MAKKKKSDVTKSQAIRDYYQAHPRAKPKQVSADLQNEGFDVTPGYVSTIRSNSKKKKKSPGRPGRPAGKKSVKRTRSAGRSPRVNSRKSQEVSIESLIRVKEVVEELGGIERTRLALSALEELTR